MDFLRSCNVLRTRFVRDSDGLTPIRWYITEDDAPPYRGWHAFGHPIWEEHFHDHFDGPGSFGHPAQWRPNAMPHPDSYTPRGLPDWYENGIPALGPPALDECGIPLIAPIGGGVCDGTGWGGGPEVPAIACGCGQPIAGVFVSPRTRSICGCGLPSSMVATHLIVSTACGCGDPMSACFGVKCVASVCGCGLPSSTQNTPVAVTSSVCGCGSSSSSSGVGTLCCPNPIPTTLHGTITNRTGTLVCLPTSITLAFSGKAGGVSHWRVTVSACATMIDWDLSCNDATGFWNLASTRCGVNSNPTTNVCSPFHLTWTGLTCPGVGSGTYQLDITV